MTTELRLALAMRGGVSLAVWIGGAVSEIDLIRMATPRDDAAPEDFWSHVLHQATGYDSVVVDVLAGASAGGLNGALYAASQVYGFSYGAMRDIWLTVGGTEGLVRRDGPWPSLFKGDDYFLSTVHQKLVELTASATPPPAPVPGAGRARVDLALSATLIEPVARPLPSPEDEPLVERRYASGFRFRQPEEPWLPTDFPAPQDTARFDDTLWRLALAARSTSSYPGAFEAAAVRSTRRPTFASQAPAVAATGPDVDLDGMFLDRTSDPLPFVVADGGILDNIPIETALDFIAHAPAAGPTERFLLYLQPGASTSRRTPAAVAVEERRTTMAVAHGVLGARVAGETINADIAAIEAYNEAVERATTLRHATFNGLVDRTGLLAAAAARQPMYRLTRASWEARQVFTLLGDPMGTLGEDQFPCTIAGREVPDACWRSPIAGWPQAEREGLETTLTGVLEDQLAQADSDPGLLAATGDVGPLLRVTDLLIEWARWVEREPALAGTAGVVKGALYRVRAFLGAVLDRSRRMAWVAAAACVADDPSGFVAAAVRAVGRMTKVEQAVADATIDALRDGSSGPLEVVCRETLDRIEGVACEVADGATPPGPVAEGAEVDLLSRLAALLVDLVEPLVEAPVDPSPAGADCAPGQLLDRVLAGSPVTVDVLEALDVLCLHEFLAGMPGRRRVDFRRLSTANRTPLAQHFTTLLDQAQADGLWWDPAVGRDQQQGIHVTLKLAGNELANFSAFLLAHWRANDWLWGRLDAVPTMVDLLVRPGPLAAHLRSHATDDEAVQAIERLVVPPGHPWATKLEALVWAPSRDAIRAEVTALRHAAADGLAAVGITATRTALIARRQWEILRTEKGLPTGPMGRSPVADPGDVDDWVAAYGVGAETLRGNTHAPELLDRFDELANAATEMALWNAKLRSSRLPPVPPAVATLVRRVGPALGRGLARRLIVVGGGGGSKRTRQVALAATALVVLAVLGWFIDKTAFLIGLAVALLPLSVLAVVLYRSVLKLLERETARGSPP